MPEVMNRTKAPLIYPVMGERKRKKEYKQVIPSPDGGPPEVVRHTLEEAYTTVLRSIVLPPRVDGGTGTLELSTEDLAALKANDSFMGAVKRGDINIISHK